MNSSKISRYERRAQELFALAGIKINGDQPCDIQVRNNAAFVRLFGYGSLGWGEAYVDGYWDCEQLDDFVCRCLIANLTGHFRPSDFLLFLRARLLNRSFPTLAVPKHYESGIELFEKMLDQRLIYSSGYWKNATTLNEAQEHKLDLVAEKLGLKAGMKVLDIGCGWGGAIRYFAERYKVSGLAVTTSKNQYDVACQTCKDLPIEIRLHDYREVSEQFDCSYSIEMLGHLKPKHYKHYFQFVNRTLREGGSHLVQVAGSSMRAVRSDPWVQRYIFPGGYVPAPSQLIAAAQASLNLEDWQILTKDHDQTFMAWHENLSAAWKDFEEEVDERTVRMWRYYLLSFAGVFRSNASQLWQIVFSKSAVNPTYKR